MPTLNFVLIYTWLTYLRIMSAQFLDILWYLRVVAYASACTHTHPHTQRNTAILCFNMPIIINAEISPYSQVIKVYEIHALSCYFNNTLCFHPSHRCYKYL